MNSLPVALYDANACRELDRLAIEQEGIAGFTLMQRAGAAAFHALQRQWPDVKSVVAVCGMGNNGGDGYVVAALAAKAGLNTQIYALGEPNSEDARLAKNMARQAGVDINAMPRKITDKPNVIVDGIFGTGLSRAPAAKWEQAIEAINQTPASVLSLDIPSGLNSDTGVAPGTAVSANLTVTFIGLKIGLLTGAGQEHTGKLVYDGLQVPKSVFSAVPPVARRLNGKTVNTWLPRRVRHAHKGNNGHTVIVGGNYSMAGAVRMAGEAAYRSGAGLVSVITRPGNMSVVTGACPEIMVHETNDPASAGDLLKRANVVAIGPGLGQDEWSMALLEKVLCLSSAVICDADALNLLALEPRRLGNWVLTPHPGEAARLLNCCVAEIQSDRPQAAREIMKRYGGTCVLKGSGTLVTTDGETTSLCSRGNPGMATGGMGDILTGVIAGLVSQGLPLHQAASAGVFLHACAGDAVAQNYGEIGLLASDLLPEIRYQINQLTETD